mmetsp:Transcript_125597/g.313857  ORF Transcript_125597/g.313857 Transcript_125597/m.313857 type:complete len:258 (-) Transcript_125597:554-1327(-)
MARMLITSTTRTAAPLSNSATHCSDNSFVGATFVRSCKMLYMPGLSMGPCCLLFGRCCRFFSCSKITFSRYSTLSSALTTLLLTLLRRSRASNAFCMASNSPCRSPEDRATSACLVQVSDSARIVPSSFCSVSNSSRAIFSSSSGCEPSQLAALPPLPSKKSKSSSKTYAPALRALPTEELPEPPTSLPRPSKKSPKMDPNESPPASYSSSNARSRGPFGVGPPRHPLRAPAPPRGVPPAPRLASQSCRLAGSDKIS